MVEELHQRRMQLVGLKRATPAVPRLRKKVVRVLPGSAWRDTRASPDLVHHLPVVDIAKVAPFFVSLILLKREQQHLFRAGGRVTVVLQIYARSRFILGFGSEVPLEVACICSSPCSG